MGLEAFGIEVCGAGGLSVGLQLGSCSAQLGCSKHWAGFGPVSAFSVDKALPVIISG